MRVKRTGEATTDAERELEATIARIGDWQGRSPRYHAIGGGITNANFRVMVDGLATAFFVKIPGKGTEAFIDRRAANEAAVNAYRAGLGPRVHRFFDDTGVEVSEFVEGFRSCNNLDFQDATIRGMAIDCYRLFNSAPLLGLTKTVFDMIDEHLEQAAGLSAPFPEDHAWLDRQYRRARAALAASGLDLVPCFNDPMPMNFMIDAARRRMLLIDYEYASNNDRCYELGIWFGEMFFSETVERELIERYFGRVEAPVFARCQVHKALADIKWGYWSLVQQKQSRLPFDFSKYGAWKFMRARAVMHDTRWEAWLRAV
jgi:thiamine kinase-like enzyme